MFIRACLLDYSTQTTTEEFPDEHICFAFFEESH